MFVTWLTKGKWKKKKERKRKKNQQVDYCYFTDEFVWHHAK